MAPIEQDHEAAPTATTAEIGLPRAPTAICKNLARGQTEVAAYFGTPTSQYFAIPALRAALSGWQLRPGRGRLWHNLLAG
jgi:hypothetical protein